MSQAHPKRRDWFRILRDLMAAGVSMAKVAKAAGRDQKTVSNWAEGGEPKDSDARVVLALYAKFCPEKYAEHCQEFTPLTEVMVWGYLESVKAEIVRRMNGTTLGER
jgi:hypothetical protein